uniref:SDR family oxidoreductase n=1 Tax=Roseihalotalea indica TaxID=2867963 RepID=A0AA49JJT3_9BACT|nr:SDR family oxidoreductase [Tunicatimonas sp. TK19036]
MKNIVVTGGTKGIGEAIVRDLCKEGHRVFSVYSSDDAAAEKQKQQLKEYHLDVIKADVSDNETVKKLASTIEAECRIIDVLINNAGIAKFKSYQEITYEDWLHTLQVNLTSTFIVTQAFLPLLMAAEKAKIINISSVAAFNGGVVGPDYTASKAGQLGLTRYYARELADKNITVNTIAPALVKTDMLKKDLDPDMMPVKRFGESEEISQAVLFLMNNDYTTGQTIHVNGGLYFT